MLYIWCSGERAWFSRCAPFDCVVERSYTSAASRCGSQCWSMGVPWLLQVSVSPRRACPDADASIFCSSDSVNARTLTVGVNTDGEVTIESCTDACFNAGYPLAGAEFADQCFCDLSFMNGGGPTDLSDCSMQCQGNQSEFCGGPNALNVIIIVLLRFDERVLMRDIASGVQLHWDPAPRSGAASWRRRRWRRQHWSARLPRHLRPSCALDLRWMLGVCSFFSHI